MTIVKPGRSENIYGRSQIVAVSTEMAVPVLRRLEFWYRQHEKGSFGAEEMKIQCREYENEGFGAEESLILV